MLIRNQVQQHVLPTVAEQAYRCVLILVSTIKIQFIIFLGSEGIEPPTLSV